METNLKHDVGYTKPLRYAVGMFGTSIPINMFKTYASYFYIEKLGLITTAQFATILFIYTFIDAIDNPVYGFVSDHTHSKWGRRRPWLVIGAPLLVLCFVMFFNPPGVLNGPSAFYYMLLMYLLTGTLDSLINANYGALFPELFKTEGIRAKTNVLRQTFQLVAMIISIALTPVITGVLGYSTTAILYGLLAIIVIWYMSFGCHEPMENVKAPQPNLLKSIKEICSNPKFWFFGITNAAFFSGLGLMQAGVPFYVKYHLGESDGSATIMLGVLIVAAIAFMPLWVKIVKKLTLIPAWRLALLLTAISIIPLYFVQNIVGASIFVLGLSFAMAGTYATMDIVGAKILDEDEERYKVHRAGTFGSLLGMLNKVSGFFTAGAYFLVFHLYGFENSNNTGPNPDGASTFLVVLFPIILMFLCAAMSNLLRFKKK